MKYLFFFQTILFLLSCKPKVNESEVKTVLPVIVQNIDTIPLDSNRMKLVLEKRVKREKFEKDINSLEKNLKISREDNNLFLLDKYLSKSDGIYTEDLMTISDEIFNLDAKSLLIYLVKNDALNLKAALIKIWSEKLSVYEGERREQELKKFKKKELERVINLGINDEEKKFLIKMLDEIDPSSFD